VLTLPRGVSLGEARMFLLRQSDWLADALARHPGRIAVDDGTLLPVGGVEARVSLVPGPRRAPVLAGGRLLVPGPGAAGPRIAAFLKSRARDALVPAARRYAGLLGRDAPAVTLRDTRSRWGSCSSAGRLSFSWRLAMAPPEILDYVAAHEAAHLAEMSHAPRFWAVVEHLLPDFRVPRAWLKREGRRLHAFHFGAGEAAARRTESDGC
jgi:predicted metal-dependent hydrolase